MWGLVEHALAKKRGWKDKRLRFLNSLFYWCVVVSWCVFYTPVKNLCPVTSPTFGCELCMRVGHHKVLLISVN